MFEFVEAKSRTPLLLKVALGMVLTFVFLYLFLPTIIIGLLTGFYPFFNHEVHVIKSHDDRYEIAVERRMNFPAVAGFDQPATITVSLRRTDSKYATYSAQFEIHEFQELTKPEVSWKHDEVHIKNLDYHREYALSFKLPDSK